MPCVHDLPGVGQNLQDHLEIYVQCAACEPVTLLTAMRPHNMVRIGLRWFLRHDGPAASSHLEAGGFIRSRAGVRAPGHPVPFPAGAGRGPRPLERPDARLPGACRADAAREPRLARLRSADPRQHPLIEPNYLAEARDRATMRACVRLTREIFAQPAFDRYRGRELSPGRRRHSDAEIDAFVRAKADSAYHPSCTCRMGTDDAGGGRSASCRVRGLDGLRVVDASIMPSIVSGNLNAPTIMLAEKAADLILGRAPLPPLQSSGVDTTGLAHPATTGPVLARPASGQVETTLSNQAEMA